MYLNWNEDSMEFLTCSLFTCDTGFSLLFLWYARQPIYYRWCLHITPMEVKKNNCRCSGEIKTDHPDIRKSEFPGVNWPYNWMGTTVNNTYIDILIFIDVSIIRTRWIQRLSFLILKPVWFVFLLSQSNARHLYFYNHCCLRPPENH